MKKEWIRLFINGVFVLIAAFLTRHYYDLGLVTINGTYRVFAICMIHMVYIGVTFMKHYFELTQGKA